jgi:threonine dehydratase
VRSELRPTPLLATELPTAFGPVAGWLKLETFQPTGSFKVRGALAALQTLPPGYAAVSASAGNHALGMAWAATRLGVPITVVTAENASPTKRAAISDFAASPSSPVRLVEHGMSYEEAESYAVDVVARESNAVYVSAYSDFAVIAGGSTIGRELELAAAVNGPLSLVVPGGGGGLSSGLSLWAAGHDQVQLVVVESTESRALSASVEAGQRVEVTIGSTIADGLAGNIEQHSPTPCLLRDAVDAGKAKMTHVSESEIYAAIRWLFKTHGLVAEGAGAVGVAAALSGKVPLGPSAIVVVTGRNVTSATFAGVISGDGTGHA